MKTSKLTPIIFFLFLLIVIAISSCKKSDNTSPVNNQPTATGTLSFHLHTNIDTIEANYGDTLMDAYGHRISVSLAQFYISGIKAQKVDGSFYEMSGVYLLKKYDPEMYLVGNLPAGNYTSVSFTVGIDATTNVKKPSSFDSLSPLYSQNPPMWFGNTSQGYIFMNFQGIADTSATHAGALNVPFSFKIGSNALLKNITMPQQNFTVLANQNQEVHITCDYGKLLNGINLKTQNTTDTYTINPSLATTIANNVSTMFRYEQ